MKFSQICFYFLEDVSRVLSICEILNFNFVHEICCHDEKCQFLQRPEIKNNLSKMLPRNILWQQISEDFRSIYAKLSEKIEF